MKGLTIIIILTLTLSSCGIYNYHFTKYVTYEYKNQVQLRTASYFFGFNQDPLDSLFRGINERGKSKYRLIVNNKGQVVKCIEIKNTFSEINRDKIFYLVKRLEYLPYIDQELSMTIFTVKQNRRYPSYLDTGLRPKSNSDLKKYGID